MSDWNPDKIKELVDAHKVIVFAKGNKMQPQCGFSAKAMDILNRAGADYEVVNIFDHPDIRPALVQFSGWPTTPQVFVKGELLGGSDTVEELANSGELGKKLAAV